MDKVALSINVGAKKSRVAEGGGCDKKSMATNTGNEHCLRRGLGEAKLLTNDSNVISFWLTDL